MSTSNNPPSIKSSLKVTSNSNASAESNAKLNVSKPSVKKPKVKKGRGAGSNEASRYNKTPSAAADDGWGMADYLAWESEQAVPTTLLADQTRKIITTNKSPDIPFSQSINPYKGCEHGCIYCYARPTHAYLDLSPGLDFESKIFYKVDAAQRLREELAKPRYVCSPIAIGTNTDPYQPGERKVHVMRDILEVLLETRHPLTIVTKSALILRDVDLLSQLAKMQLVKVNVSVTTLSNELKTKLEPRTAGPAARLRTITELNEAGVPTGAMLAPIIPFINDHEMEDLVKEVAAAGAREVRYILIRLPLEVAPLFEEWLENHYPLKASRVMSAIRDTRGGKRYQSKWHQRMVGSGPIAQLIRTRFHNALEKAGLAESLNSTGLRPLRTDLFRPPNPSSQMSLF
ncbi:MAG: PA0069 family radical SAM protein [Pseudomonadota bacterium]